MLINRTAENEKLTFSIEGRLDTTTAPRLQEVLLPAFDETKEITLDFTNLDYVSSAGLRVLLMGHKEAKKKGGAMTVINVSPDVLEVLEMTGFTDMLSIV